MLVIQDVVDDLSIEVPDLIDTTIKRMVVFAVQEFCRASEVLKHRESITLISGKSSYDLVIPSNTYVLSTRYVRDSQGHILTAVQPSDLVVSTVESHPVVYTSDSTSIKFNSLHAGDVVDVEVILQPTRQVISIADPIMDSYFEAVRAGALSRLLLMPNKPWTNPKIADMYQFSFHEAIVHARRESRGDRSRPSRITRFNAGFMW